MHLDPCPDQVGAASARPFLTFRHLDESTRQGNRSRGEHEARQLSKTLPEGLQPYHWNIRMLVIYNTCNVQTDECHAAATGQVMCDIACCKSPLLVSCDSPLERNLLWDFASIMPGTARISPISFLSCCRSPLNCRSR